MEIIPRERIIVDSEIIIARIKPISLWAFTKILWIEIITKEKIR